MTAPTLARLIAPLALAVMAALPQAAAAADPLPAPQGEVLLTVTGAITRTNDGAAAAFDQDMLSALDPVTFETTTIWTEGRQSFTGVPLKTLMEAVGATAQSMNATAVNDYAVRIPAGDWVEGGPIVAYLQNGRPMSLRDKGPLWIIYPFDGEPAFQNEVTYSRSIWQLDRIVVGD